VCRAWDNDEFAFGSGHAPQFRHVLFGSEPVVDRAGVQFLLIQVRTFQEIPVICAVDDEAAGVKKATLYYRTSDRRPESAPISNSYDMRTLLDLAAIRMRARRKAVGWVAPDELAKKLDKELGGL